MWAQHRAMKQGQSGGGSVGTTYQSKGRGCGEVRIGQAWRGGAQGGGRPMGTAAYRGKGFKESTRVSGDRPIGAASFRQQCIWLSCPPSPPKHTHTHTHTHIHTNTHTAAAWRHASIKRNKVREVPKCQLINRLRVYGIPPSPLLDQAAGPSPGGATIETASPCPAPATLPLPMPLPVPSNTALYPRPAACLCPPFPCFPDAQPSRRRS